MKNGNRVLMFSTFVMKSSSSWSILFQDSETEKSGRGTGWDVQLVGGVRCANVIHE